jgi:hypothetical protein
MQFKKPKLNKKKPSGHWISEFPSRKETKKSYLKQRLKSLFDKITKK